MSVLGTRTHFPPPLQDQGRSSDSVCFTGDLGLALTQS